MLGRLASIVAKVAPQRPARRRRRCAGDRALRRPRSPEDEVPAVLEEEDETKALPLAPSIPAAPAKILWRTVADDPHQDEEGSGGAGGLKAYEECRRRTTRVLRLQAGHKYCLLGRLSSEVGWNHYETIKELENKRKEKAQVAYERRKQLAKLRLKAEKVADEKLGSQLDLAGVPKPPKRCHRPLTSWNATPSPLYGPSPALQSSNRNPIRAPPDRARAPSASAVGALLENAATHPLAARHRNDVQLLQPASRCPRLRRGTDSPHDRAASCLIEYQTKKMITVAPHRYSQNLIQPSALSERPRRDY
ncbi:uncharacterized protein A4U43_C02F2510 [Asparagus officinalis]|uniref:60S ribosomal protein L13a n=1 Tax=Asparagus officinalis TaxID=4686 RepID=A0A5P1FH39_ASPOF|nr:uncharacterized protein A4U43_C02F2510 [Asparagus officinalis]